MPVTTKSTEFLNAIVGGKSDSIELVQTSDDSNTFMHFNKLKYQEIFDCKEAAYSFLKERYDTIEIIGTKTETTLMYKFPTKIK